MTTNVHGAEARAGEATAGPPGGFDVRCLRCGTTGPGRLTAYLCPACGAAPPDNAGILDVVYPPTAAKDFAASVASRRRRRTDVFRWAQLLPVQPDDAGLPAGNTPLVTAPRLAAGHGVGQLWLKNETRNPTGSLKDRATAVGVALGRRLGYTDFYCASAGNAAISLAGFCANLGLGCHVFVPHTTPPGRITALERFGADVTVHPGDYDQTFDESERIGQARGWYSRNCAFNPFLVEGKKTAAFEIAEQLDWTAPDVVVAPVGDGCTLAALGKGFRELVDAGLLDRAPRLVGAQVEAFDPLVRRWRDESGEPRGGPTHAVSIAVRRPRNSQRLLNEVTASGGMLVRVDEAAVARAKRTLALAAGVECEFTSATTLAALDSPAVQESLDLADQRVVLVVTGGRIDAA